MKVADQHPVFTRRDCELAIAGAVAAIAEGQPSGIPQAAALGLCPAPQWAAMLPYLDQRLAAARQLVELLTRATATAEAASEFDEDAQPDARATRARADAAAAIRAFNENLVDQVHRRGGLLGRGLLLELIVKETWAPAIPLLLTLLEQARAEAPPSEALRARIDAVANQVGIEPRRALQLALDAARTALHRQGKPFLDHIGELVVGALAVGPDDVVVRVGATNLDQLAGEHAAAHPYAARLSLNVVEAWRGSDALSWARGPDAVVLRREDLAAQ